MEFVHECVKGRPRLVGKQAPETRMKVRIMEMMNLEMYLEMEPCVAKAMTGRIEEEAEEFGRAMKAKSEISAQAAEKQVITSKRSTGDLKAPDEAQTKATSAPS